MSINPIRARYYPRMKIRWLIAKIEQANAGTNGSDERQDQSVGNQGYLNDPKPLQDTEVPSAKHFAELQINPEEVLVLSRFLQSCGMRTSITRQETRVAGVSRSPRRSAVRMRGCCKMKDATMR